MNSLFKGYQKLQNLINELISGLLLLIMCVILAQTFFRFVIFKSLPWSEELSRYLFVAMILLGINIGVTKNLMVRIDIIDGFLSDNLKKVFEVGREMIALIVSCAFFYSTFDMIKVGSFQKSPALQLPMSLMYTMMAVGFGLTILSVLFRLAETIGTKGDVLL